MTDIETQIERLRSAVALFFQVHGRVPSIILDADGVIYDFETALLAHHNRVRPDLPASGPFTDFNMTEGHSEETATALVESMMSMDWSDLQPYPQALPVIQVLLELGIDLSVATSHLVRNIYSASAKVYQFNRDFDALLDNSLVVTLDKTRVVGDILIDDKPEIDGKLVPQWERLYFTQEYNKDLPGIHVTWETMFEVLAEFVESRIAGTPMTPAAAPEAAPAAEPVALPWADEAKTVADEPAPVADAATEGAEEAAPWELPAPVAMPWEEETEEAKPVSEVSWADLVGGDDK